MIRPNTLCALLCLLVGQEPSPPAPALTGPVLTGEERFAAGVAHYRAGRNEAAHAEFAAAMTARGAASPAEFVGNLALAALRLQRTGEAEAAARSLAADPDPVVRARGEFLLAAAALQRGERAAAAALLQDAEPMAWESAVRSVEAAIRGWVAAADLRSGWPEALRNAERAQRRLVELQQLRAVDDARRRDAAREPEPPPAPLAPAPTDEPPQEQVPELPRDQLPPAAVAKLLQRLQEKELEKQRGRQVAQRAAAVVGARDW